MPKKEITITQKYLPPSLLGWCKEREGVVLRENILFLNHLCLAYWKTVWSDKVYTVCIKYIQDIAFYFIE